ncbi:GSCFA domain-containing protein [Ekhidna sp.]|uniref:GSCFA domain-containing protein n=1 Tax=Ekhidna sp. TaxID=2608089 RepID=UPI003B50190C
MFKLSFDIPESKHKISLSDPILLIGSCFSDEIGLKLSESKFNTLCNPFGTIYNPHSIFKLLSNLSKSNNVVESQGVQYHWDTHGKISGLNPQETIDLFEKINNETQNFLMQTNWLFITLGTAIVYERMNGDIVANCHKVPGGEFRKRFLNQDEIKRQFSTLHTYLEKINPRLNIVFTVSPVRHIRDGLIENNQSKAILIDSIRSITENYPNTTYFPSYEIAMDELRDYRFFQEDRIHPTNEAIDYVWNRFIEAYLDKEAIGIIEEWSKLKAALHHRPFQPQSTAHQTFLKSTLKKMEELNEKVDLSVEMNQLKQQIQ